MFITCPACRHIFNDEYRSTICPHVGIGFCEICDCPLCVCDQEEKGRRRAARMPKPDAGAALPADLPPANSLLHDFVLCERTDCGGTGEHCELTWCGAPRNHPNHTQTAERVLGIEGFVAGKETE